VKYGPSSIKIINSFGDDSEIITFQSCNIPERLWKGSNPIIATSLRIDHPLKILLETEGGNKMDLILKQDISKLMADTAETKLALERLEEDHAVWARKREEKDLTTFINNVQELEFDVSVLMGDCFFLSRIEKGRRTMEDFHQAYVCMNALFQDIKRARNDLNKAYICPEELSGLKIDWKRLRKSIGRIQKHIQDGKAL
jgi:hypothetical protein